MLLQLVCGALALSQVVSGRGALRARPPREDDGLDGVSNLQMLIPLLIEDSQAEQSRGPPASRSAPLYTDGSYSDIPAEAFVMEPSKASEKHTSTIKKDLSQFRAVDAPSPSSPPDAVVAGCVRYFQGRSAATSSNTEALLQLCTEILDDADVQDVVHVHVDGEPCACCAAEPPTAPPRPRAEEAQGGEALGSLVQTLMKLFSAGGGSRRRWLIMNSNHPDPQMRQYVDVES